MTGWLMGLFIFIILQRIVELVIARRNEKWMKQQGATEFGAEHYKWFVITHAVFFVFIILESFLSPITLNENISFRLFLISLFIFTQILRIWCIASLGKFWNTKVIVLPGVPLINHGPYRFIKHPNYVIVGIELIVIPLLFNAIISALLFPLLHMILLKIRIPIEERALISTMNTD
ncbi:isoprenylcysteine carboxyl methyltransferase family protein [Aquibacillus rhizosphaerae]|uniref:Isoprenylcysteine carboxylmethyltransferase family protein n=1 Tax=Aquibacillus rhizosphaerae TaxID=3051431 RepID=A0ABT7L3H3_9BACI|nr:isoprenylcysteine carboxylmethyltransferase family protein [Aquibacillus sp. LR5S19]MDL4839735.1 isoprenylcysteine carboxylmethyltransferase family protein [Aquibacillus sp. LR5S19]